MALVLLQKVMKPRQETAQRAVEWVSKQTTDAGMMAANTLSVITQAAPF